MPIRPPVNSFELVIPSLAITGITAGPTITPGNNAYGTEVQLLDGASLTEDAWAITINISQMAVSGVARSAMAQVLADGVVIIPDLLCGSAGAISGAGLGGDTYHFPLRIPALSTISMAMSVNNATVGTATAFIKLHCRPTRPDMIRAGSFVRAFGATPGTSSGTAITPGTSVKSAFVQLGSALAEPLWYWQLGVSANQAAQNNNAQAWDLAVGDATNRRIVVDNQIVIPTTSEVVSFNAERAYAQCAVGDLVYARAASSGAAAAGWSVAAYGVGG